MENFKQEEVTNEFGNSYTTFTENGFHSALVVTKQSQVSGDNVEEWQEVVPLERVKPVFEHALEGGNPQSSRSIPYWEESYYWLVPLRDGSYYPFPLLFSSQEERVRSNRSRNDELWRQFYEGVIGSKTLRYSLKTAPSEAEVFDILNQLEAITQGESPWEYEDEEVQRGCLVPRWADQ